MKNSLTSLPAALTMAVALLSLPSAATADILFGGLGGHNNGDSTNDGALGIVNQTTGVVTIVGHPAGVSRISGLAFGLTGTLYGSTLPSGGFPPPPGPTGASNLIQIDRNTGALISSKLITDGVNGISIADLAVQPGTGVLYGIRAPVDQLGGQGKLYTINTVTGLATLVGDTGHFFGSIAFAPSGTLYMSAADLDAMDNIVNISLKTLNPTNAAELTSVATADFFGALAVRPSDSKIFGGNGDAGQLFTINPSTGVETLVGNTGRNFVGDLAFLARGSDFESAYQVDYSSNLLTGDSYVNITNAGTRNGFDPAGGICASVYVFDPSEEMVSCCSCYVSPDGLRSLSSGDLITNALTASKPAGIVIKLLASQPTGTAGTTCDPTAPTIVTLEGGMRAWSTSLHQNTTSSAQQLTEHAFQNATLSDSELEKLKTFCGFIKANGSNFGVCKECRVGGGLGGVIR